MIVLRQRGSRRTGVTHGPLLGVLLGTAPTPVKVSASADAVTGDLGVAGPSAAEDGLAAADEKAESKASSTSLRTLGSP
jgi:hypothetical protein